MDSQIKEKNIYFVKSDKNNALTRQLERANTTLSYTTNYLFNRDKKAFLIGEIYNCYYDKKEAKSIKVVVIKSSGEYENSVLICPIKTKYECYFDGEDGINLGIIHSLSLDNEYYAQIQNIQIVHKDLFKLENGKIKDARPCAFLNKNTILKILNCYRDFISNIINLNFKYDEIKNNYTKLYSC